VLALLLPTQTCDMVKNKLADTVLLCFTSEVINQLGAAVDENSPDVVNLLENAVPVVINALVTHVSQEGESAALLKLAHEADAAGALNRLASIQNNAWHEQGSNLLLDLLGNTYRSTVNHLAAEANIRPAAAGTLLQVAATAVLGVLGRFATDNDLTASGFSSWLQAQKNEISAAIFSNWLQAQKSDASVATLAKPTVGQPPATALGVAPPLPPTLPPIALANRSYTAASAPRPAPKTGLGTINPAWLWAALLVVLVAGAGYYIGQDQRPASQQQATTSAIASSDAPRSNVARDASPTVMPAVTGRYDQDKDTYIYDTGRPITLTLANGHTQRVGANSTENRLFTFLATRSIQVDSVNRTKGWINFDRVNFEPTKATLTPGSERQLQNIAVILKSFPEAVVKIGGYTDSTGVPLRNLQLSEERAKTAMMALATMGVNAEHLQSKGYGAKYFVAPNNTPTGRALNRRISIRVIKK
jgi:OOP family OmpA-OmpF porin